MRSFRAWVRLPLASMLLALSLAATVACGSSATPAGSPRPAAPTASAPRSAPNSTTSTEVSFKSDGVTTYGTLEVPGHRDGQRLAAALLIGGSGPTDRDGNQPPAVTPDTEKVVADLLARQGIITLRYDKYFSGKTGPGPRDPASEPVDVDLKQADAAYQLLAREPDVDPATLLVVGHSEGGMIALYLAANEGRKPAGLGLLEPQDVRILDLLALQIAEGTQQEVADGQVTKAAARRSNQAVRRAIAQVRDGDLHVKPTGMTELAIRILQENLNAAPRYELTWDRIDPAVLAGQVPRGTRVLVTDGTRDTKVPPSTIGPLVKALSSAGAAGPGLRMIQDADHDLHLSSQPDNDAVLAPAAVTAIRRWAAPFSAH